MNIINIEIIKKIQRKIKKNIIPLVKYRRGWTQVLELII